MLRTVSVKSDLINKLDSVRKNTHSYNKLTKISMSSPKIFLFLSYQEPKNLQNQRIVMNEYCMSGTSACLPVMKVKALWRREVRVGIPKGAWMYLGSRVE